MKKTYKYGDELSVDEVQYIRDTGGSGKVLCPDCTSGVLRAGPRGGISLNCKCDNEGCGSKFNIGFPMERISDASPNRKKLN